MLARVPVALLATVVCCLAPGLVLAQSLPAQDSDWLVHPPNIPTQLTTEADGTLRLSNGLIERVFFHKEGAFCTVEYRHLISKQTFLRALSPAANLTLNGTDFDVGGCKGQPLGHNEFWMPDVYFSNLTNNPEAFQYVSHSTTPPTKLFEWTPGIRSSPTDVAWPPKGLHLTVVFVPPSTKHGKLMSAGGHTDGVTVSVHFEMYDNLPVLRKWVTVHRSSYATTPVVVDTLNYELLRAPNFAPESMAVVPIQRSNPTPLNQQIVPRHDQSFPSRSYQLWYIDDDYDAPHDRELHVPYTYYTSLVVGYMYDVGYQGLTGPGAVVAPGETFDSLSVREVLHDSLVLERQGLAVRQMDRMLSPQLLENPLTYMTTDASSSTALRLAVDQASATGYELLIIGYGAKGWCGMCFDQISNSTFKAWFKGEVAYANSKNVEMSGYTLMQHNGWGEVTPESEQTLNRDGKRGPTACFGTDFHTKYREAVLSFIQETGMGGLETDGQYEAIACADKEGDHHHNGLEGGWSYGVEVTRRFNERLKDLGVYQTGADAYSFSGANKWNHADTDAFNNLPLWERLTVGRMYIYDSTVNRLPSSGQMGVNDLATLSKNCDCDRLMCFDFAIGSQYLMGSIPSFRTPVLWDPADPDASSLSALLLKWTSFYKQFRGPRPSGAAGLLLSKAIHLLRPDSRHLEAVLHVTADNSTAHRGLLGISNPTLAAISQDVVVDLYYTGLPFGTTVIVTEMELAGLPLDPLTQSPAEATRRAREKHVLGERGAGFTGIFLHISSAASSYAGFLISTN